MSYDDRQAASILKKAAELQSARAGGDGDPKLSIEDLKRIGAEVGIAPEMVEEASRRLGTRGARRGKLNTERVLTVDRELGEREYEEIVAILRSEYGHAGTASTLGSAYEWSAGEMSSLHLSMVPRDGKTTITVATRRDGIVVAWLFTCIFNFLGIIIPLAIMGKRGQILTGALIAICVTLFLVGGTTLLTRSGARRADRQLDEVMERIADTVAKPAAAPTMAEPAPAIEERAELDQQA